jgi:hypothetical protein
MKTRRFGAAILAFFFLDNLRCVNASTGNSSMLLSFNDSTTFDTSFVIDNFVFSRNKWSTEEYKSYALWGAGTYSSFAWGSLPSFIASYSCQGPYIAEKLLSLGGENERLIVTNWLHTLPISQAGKVWEAQNSEWHVQVQGTWESSSELLIMIRHLAAYTDAQIAINRAPERLLCSSIDGITYSILDDGVIQPGITDDVCTQAPASLLLNPLFFADFPSQPFSGPSEQLANSGRILTQAFTLQASISYLSLPIFAKNSKELWEANVTVYDIDGNLVGFSLISRDSDLTKFTVIKLIKTATKGTTLIAILSLNDNGAPTGQTSKDSWFLSLGWITNSFPSTNGGANSVTYGLSPHWLRNASSISTDPRLVKRQTPTLNDAVSFEIARVLSKVNKNEPLGLSLADYTALALSWVLALASQTPTESTGGYDVFVIPDSNFRGSFEDDVDSGCSYYDLLRIGFASSYINLRTLEGILSYAELQEAGILPSTCEKSSFGIDNAYVLDDFVIPCYTNQEITAIVETMRFAIGNRFSNDISGQWVDWFGCSILGVNENTTECGLANVKNGVSDAAPNLIAIKTDFVPTIALAAKLGVKAGGTNATTTLEELSRAIAFEDNETSLAYHGPGWFPNALLPLELSEGGARSTLAYLRWDLKDSEGFAIRSENETGDWQMFPFSSVQSGMSSGYGQYGGQAENGGRFFTTTAMIFEAVSSPLSGLGNVGPYEKIARDFRRIIVSLDSIGRQLQSGQVDTPLLSNDRLFLASPVTDPLVFDLCTKVRKEFNFPNKTDAWGQRLCDYYQDACWATPESGAVIFAFVKGLLGVHVTASGTLHLIGFESSPWTASSPPWNVSKDKNNNWPEELEGIVVKGLAIRGLSLSLECDQNVTSIQCSVDVL